MSPILSSIAGARSFGTLAQIGGRFVAMGAFGSASLYSVNGYSWNTTTLPSGEYYYTMYGNGKFVSASSSINSNKVIYSSDGITWSSSTLPSVGNWYASAFGGGKFIVLGDSNSSAAYSSDGVNWTGTSISAEFWSGAIYGSDKFIAVQSSGSSSAYAISTNGITWSTSNFPISGNWNSIVYGSNGFVSLSTNSNQGVISKDGISWNTITMPTSSPWYYLAYGNKTYLAAHDSGIATSRDGISWTTRTAPITGISSITFGSGIFVMISYNTGTQNIAISKDGITWTLISHPSTTFLASIAFGQ